MGHYLQQQHLLVWFCITYTVVYSPTVLSDGAVRSSAAPDSFLRPFISNPSGTGSHFPLLDLEKIDSAHSVDVSLVLILRPNSRFGDSMRNRMKKVLGEVVGVDSEDVLISGVQKIPSCELNQQDQGPRQRRQKEGAGGKKMDKQLRRSPRNLLIENEPLIGERSSEEKCQHGNGAAKAGDKSLVNKMKLNVGVQLLSRAPGP